MHSADQRNPWRPDPDDDRVPIGPPDTISMYRARILVAVLRRSVLVLVAKLAKYFGDNRSRQRIAQHPCRDVARFHQKLFDCFLPRVHASSVLCSVRPVHSYFPTLILIDSLHCGQARSIRHA